jgi:hypothetical protein
MKMKLSTNKTIPQSMSMIDNAETILAGLFLLE